MGPGYTCARMSSRPIVELQGEDDRTRPVCWRWLGQGVSCHLKPSPQRMLRNLDTLAREIGPRGTGTAGEAAAADFVATRVSELGLPLEWQKFRAVTSQNAFPLAIDWLALAAVALYPLDGAPARWLAAALALVTAPLLWQTIRTSNCALRPWLPQAPSQNVVTRIEPRGETRQRVVFLAHLDTNRCRMAWQSSTVRSLEPLTYLTLAILASLGLIYLIGAWLGGPRWLWWISLLPGGYVLATVITLWVDDRTPFSCGANDNAASVVVGLETAARLAQQPLERTQVWVAFTGAEETDHAGLHVLLQAHVGELREAAFIGLEGVGNGDIVYLNRQGLINHYRPDAELLALAGIVAARRPEFGVSAAQMTMEDEVGTLRRAGYRAICVAGRDPSTGSLPHWHRPDDTVDTVSPEVLERAVGFVMALLQELDNRQTLDGGK